MENRQIRQGDVLLVPAEVHPPKGAKMRAEVILAEGEVTGHAHRLRGATVLEWEQDGQRYVRVLGTEMGTLSHEDHDPEPVAVIVPDVTYRVVLQQQWDLSGQWMQVTD
jgi:hypothetical protein